MDQSVVRIVCAVAALLFGGLLFMRRRGQKSE
jgi:hypothetical protein